MPQLGNRPRSLKRWPISLEVGLSALMPANLTTFAHFSVSSATNFLNSVVEPGAAPKLDRPGLQLGICESRVHLGVERYPLLRCTWQELAHLCRLSQTHKVVGYRGAADALLERVPYPGAVAGRIVSLG